MKEISKELEDYINSIFESGTPTRLIKLLLTGITLTAKQCYYVGTAIGELDIKVYQQMLKEQSAENKESFESYLRMYKELGNLKIFLLEHIIW